MTAKYEYKLIDPSTWELNNSNVNTNNYKAPLVLPDDTLVVCGKQSGMKYSVDGGATWKSSNVNPTGYNTPAVLSDGTTLVAGATNIYDDGVGIVYSTNKGVSWQDSNITTGSYNTPAVLSDDTLVIGSSNSDIGIKYSTDKGVTWQDSNITTGNYITPAVLPDGTLIIGSDSNSGIKYSTDKGKTWHDSSITSGKYGTPAVLSDGTLVIGSSSDVGIKYSTDKGVTWKNSNIAIGKYGTAAVLSDDTLVICGKDNNIRYSTDKGVTWQDSYTTMDGYNTTIAADGYYTPTILPDGTLVICSDSTSYYTTGWGIRYSTDKGATWQKSNITSGVYAPAILSDGTLVIFDTDRNTGIKYFKALDVFKVTDKYLDKAGLKVLVDKIKETQDSGGGSTDDWINMYIEPCFDSVNITQLQAYYSTSRRVIRFNGYLSLNRYSTNATMVSNIIRLVILDEMKNLGSINTSCSCCFDGKCNTGGGLIVSKNNNKLELKALWTETGDVSCWMYLGSIQL